ncbi:MAG: sugar phosphate isomerase/epimerase [Anaerolineae bacterium]|nr:sugar phosphate isomerase/epimerase [Anaerolineae bacterium]
MRKAINMWAFTPDKSLADCFRLARDAGFEGVELAYDAQGPVSPATSDPDLQGIRSLAESMGLALPTLASGIFWSKNILSPEAAEREEAKEHVRHMLRIAATIGASTILVVPGFVGPFLSGAPVVADYQEAHDRALADFRELASDAERWQVNIGIENVWNRFLTAPFEMRDFVDAVGSPFVGVYFDVGNVMRTGYPEHWIKILGSRVRAVHFKDFRCNVGTLEGFVELLQGDVDYPAVVRALQAVGYNGWAVVEQFPPNQFPDDMIYRASRAVDVIFGGETR